MVIPSPLAYVLAGGIALLILERVFSFIKWMRNKEEAPPVEDNPGSLSDRQVLDSIFRGQESLTGAVGTLAVDVGVVKTQVGFLAKAQETTTKTMEKCREQTEKKFERIDAELLKCARERNKK